MFLSLHSQAIFAIYIYVYTLPVTKYFREDRYIHYLKSVRIWSFFRPYFAAFGLCILFECGKIRTRKTPNTGTFHAVVVVVLVAVVVVVVVLALVALVIVVVVVVVVVVVAVVVEVVVEVVVVVVVVQ